MDTYITVADGRLCLTVAAPAVAYTRCCCWWRFSL